MPAADLLTHVTLNTGHRLGQPLSVFAVCVTQIDAVRQERL